MKNPLMDFQIGDEENIWKNKIETNFSKGVISQQYENENIFRYYFIKGKDSIYTDVHINSDNYNFGKLRTLKFDLRGDTTNYFGEKEYMRSLGPRDMKTVDKLLGWFIEYYGEPTDTIPNIPFSFVALSDKRVTPEEKFQEIFEIRPEPGSLIWEKENFTIEFYRLKEYKFFNDSTPIKTYNNSYVIYKINGLEEELKKITEPIRANFTAKNVAHVTVEYPQWEQLNKSNYWDYDYQFKIDIRQVQRIGREETRKITDVQFDIILTDAFEKEIYRIPEVKLELDEPIELHKAFLTPMNTYFYSVKYSSLSKDKMSLGLEQARILKQTTKLKCHAEVSAVVFEDGEVLR
jgi:hypothetical protein